MVKITYRMHDRNDGRVFTAPFAYFPTHRAALVLMARWNQQDRWMYEIITVEQVPCDSRKWHPDYDHYKHLCG